MPRIRKPRVHKVLIAVVTAVVALAAGWMAFPPAANAATLTEITGFGTNPGNLRMYLYVPDNTPANAPIVVVNHYCTGDGPAMFNNTEFRTLADQHKYIAVYPSVTRSSKCFDVSSPATLTHNGGGDSRSIVSMVDWVVANRGGDRGRVYSTGISSGAMMTNVLLGSYPDVFKAGSAFSGVPFACFATTDGSEWNSQCSNGQRIMTPQQWGDLVRNAYPGYTGARPRMQTWHGTEDATLRYQNFTEQIKQWTNVHGLSQTPTFTDTPQSGWTRTRYGGSGATAPVEAVSMQGVGHDLMRNGMAAQAIAFFGITGGGTNPTATATSSPPPGGSGPCRVAYGVNAWNTGLTAGVTVTNTGTSTVNGWSLVFTLPSGQTITQGWGATYAPMSGQVTATNVSYNSTLAAGASISIGFNANHTGNTAEPTSFTLNGSACTVV